MTTTIDREVRNDGFTMTAAAGIALACQASEERVVRAFGDEATSRARQLAGSLHGIMAHYCGAQHVAAPRNGHDLTEAVTNLDREIGGGSSTVGRIRAEMGAGTFAMATSLAGEVLVRQAYDAGAVVQRAIAAPVTVASFRDTPSISLEQSVPFARVGHGGTLPVAGLSDERRGTVKLETSGVALLIPRQILVDDNMGAMAAIFSDLGRRAALAVDYELFQKAVMEATDSFYHASNANLATGSALSSSTLGTAEALMWNQVDKHKRPIGARPRTLLVPPALTHTARALIATQPEGNTRLQLMVSPLLSLDGMPGASATTFYLVADPNTGMPAFQVATLVGNPAPTIAAMPMTADGVRLRCYYDFACSAVDPRGAVKATA